jgi:invasion protein IalB
MNGPSHYRKAEALLDEVDRNGSMAKIGAATAIAQVHATLALAAATALDPATDMTEYGAWGKACQTPAYEPEVKS